MVAHLRKHVSYADGMAHRSKLAYVFLNFKEPIALSRTLFCGKYVVNLESFKRFFNVYNGIFSLEEVGNLVRYVN